jgi:hypothetical protein
METVNYFSQESQCPGRDMNTKPPEYSYTKLTDSKNSLQQNYWVLGLYPSSGILENRKHDVSESVSVSVLR